MPSWSREKSTARSYADIRDFREAVRRAKAEYHGRRKLADEDEFAALSAAVNDSVTALRAAQEA